MDRPRSSALHARARAFVTAFEEGRAPPETFDALACDVARYQADHSEGYARLCRARGIDPSKLTNAADAPPVPTDAFKLTEVTTFDAADAAVTFRTSGTTLGTRGTHRLRDVSTYDLAAVAFGRHWLARDRDERLAVIVLGPSAEDAPDSSLAHMCRAFVKAFGEEAPADKTYFLKDDVLDVSAFDERTAYALARDVPVLVLATSFALVHLLDGIGDATFRLPPRSRVMMTGGFKGKSREVDPAALRKEVGRAFAIDERGVVGEYGMTELSSQFYEPTFYDGTARHGVYVEPPWARVVPVDPETLAPVPDGEIGIAKIIDLMNVDSAVAVLAQDRVRRISMGFELFGRAKGATPRGCSIAIDELLGRVQ